MEGETSDFGSRPGIVLRFETMIPKVGLGCGYDTRDLKDDVPFVDSSGWWLSHLFNLKHMRTSNWVIFFPKSSGENCPNH